MKVSEITTTVIVQQLREDESALMPSDLEYIDTLKAAAIDYVRAETGIYGVDEPDDNGRKLDDYEDISIAVLTLISDMYDQRQYSVEKKGINRVVDGIIAHHRFNLIPEAAE